MIKSRSLARTIVATAKDEKERKEALRLQVHAWRQVALIGLVDRAQGVELARTLFIHSVPFVNGPLLSQMIADTQADAERCGRKAGVFD